MKSVSRCNGYLPIGSYAVLGDGRTVALVATDGAIDWFPVPALDARPAFAAILDPAEGGQVELAPAVPYSVQRGYRPGTAVLETTFTTASARVTVVDCLNRPGDGPLPWRELARVIRAEGGDVPMRWRVRPGRRFGTAGPWTQPNGTAPLVHTGGVTAAVLTSGAGRPILEHQEVTGRFTAVPGETSLLALIATENEPIMVPPAGDVISRVDATTDHWRAWRRRIGYRGLHANAVIRSALTLRLLTEARNGASAAAATTGLPEVIGGDRNYDYRFAWVRDASFALDALTSLGLAEEVHAMLSWLLGAVYRTAPDVHVLYTLGGEPAHPGERNVVTAPGYRGTRPVREGNSAAGQRQLGSYGHLMDAAYHYVQHGGVLGPTAGGMLANMAGKVCDLWREPDAGLWELSDYQHYTSSKVGCWTALDRAIWLAEHGQLPGWHANRWRAGAAEIHDWVDEHCWSPVKRSYTMHPGTDDLDAAVLLMARTGFCRDKERLHSTIDAVSRELAATGPLLYRYSAMRGKEGAFAACTFWLAEALALAGRSSEASDVFGAMLDHCNDVGLLSEEIDPNTGELLGNFPQGLSHLALIGAARALQDGPAA